MGFRITKKGSTLKTFMKAIEDLNRSSIEVGHFAEQPLHYSGMSYPALLSFWKTGVPTASGSIVQDVRSQFAYNYFVSRQVNNDRVNIVALREWYAHATTPNSTSKLLETIGANLARTYRAEFNVYQGPYMLGTSTPLFETGELSENTVFRTSKNTSLKKG